MVEAVYLNQVIVPSDYLASDSPKTCKKRFFVFIRKLLTYPISKSTGGSRKCHYGLRPVSYTHLDVYKRQILVNMGIKHIFPDVWLSMLL